MGNLEDFSDFEAFGLFTRWGCPSQVWEGQGLEDVSVCDRAPEGMEHPEEKMVPFTACVGGILSLVKSLIL